MESSFPFDEVVEVADAVEQPVLVGCEPVDEEAAPAGGSFTRTAIWPIPKTSKNPDADLVSQQDPDNINGDFRISTFEKVKCSNASDVQGIYGNACRFPVTVPLG